ncbi:hypothetical protein PoB_002533500 [Plakobranchus ocellatus]|uniref:Uncharacterized protein n=1 Tax=Plakobranchus ocellatus TaxID=259542 RepID=A0AAV3ZW25_9GAST|nr:hypothetical protein PoB_002533500 [Plakobranchus ocellatus]
MACESALRSAGTLVSRVRAPLPAPWPDGGPECLRSPCCGLAIYKKLKNSTQVTSGFQNMTLGWLEHTTNEFLQVSGYDE